MKIDEIKEQFKEGPRIIMVMQRKKDGHSSDKVIIRELTTTPQEFNSTFNRYKKQVDTFDEDYRIYSSINERDFNRATKELRKRQLDIEEWTYPQRVAWYKKLDSNFLSILMEPTCRNRKNFLIDIDDNKYSSSYVLKELSKKKVNVLFTYETPNGSHIITEPFNPNYISDLDVEIKKDAMMLAYYSWENNN